MRRSLLTTYVNGTSTPSMNNLGSRLCLRTTYVQRLAVTVPAAVSIRHWTAPSRETDAVNLAVEPLLTRPNMSSVLGSPKPLDMEKRADSFPYGRNLIHVPTVPLTFDDMPLNDRFMT